MQNSGAVMAGYNPVVAEPKARPAPGFFTTTLVGDDKFDAMEAARLEGQQKIPPARSAFAIGDFDPVIAQSSSYHDHPRPRFADLLGHCPRFAELLGHYLYGLTIREAALW